MIKSPLLSGDVSRRGVLKGASAIGGAALITPMGTRLASAQPVRGGTLRMGLSHGSTTDGPDPGTWENDFTNMQGYTRNGYLTEVAADGSLVPEVAESWEASADAAEWTFSIRPGVMYHSGGTVTAEDVVASINHHRGEDSTSAAAPIVAPIVDMRVDGMNVIFTLAEGNADFPFILSDYHLPILPSVDGAIDPMTLDGCGAYKIDNIEWGVSANFSRHDGYWKQGVAHFDAVEFITIHDAAARQNALISGEVDYIDSVDLNTVHLLQRAPGMVVQAITGYQHYTLPMDSRNAPLDDNNVRLALKYAIDREQIVETILNGYGSVGNDHPISSANRFFNSELPQREYDPERARHHLNQAGLDSLDIQIHLADAAFGGAVDAGVLYSESASAGGINLEVVREPNDGYWSNVWMQVPFTASYWSGRPTEDWMFATAYSEGASWNESYWSHDRFNELLVAARAELNEDLRRDMYWEMQQIVSDEGASVVPMFAQFVNAHADTLAHPETVGGNWRNDGLRIAERWWFA